MATCLAWGDGAVASHRSAAALYSLPGFDERPIELTVPPGRHRAGDTTITHRNRLLRADRASIDGIPTTTPARTLIDLACVAPSEDVEEALDDALRRRLVTLSRLRRRLDELGIGRCGIKLIRSLCDVREGRNVPRSVFETRLLRVLRRARLPAPLRQHVVRDRTRVVAVIDFAYPDLKLGIEADGYRWHSGRARWEHDRARRNTLTRLGWQMLHVTWEELHRAPDEVVENLRSTLGHISRQAGPHRRT